MYIDIHAKQTLTNIITYGEATSYFTHSLLQGFIPSLIEPLACISFAFFCISSLHFSTTLIFVASKVSGLVCLSVPTSSPAYLPIDSHIYIHSYLPIHQSSFFSSIHYLPICLLKSTFISTYPGLIPRYLFTFLIYLSPIVSTRAAPCAMLSCSTSASNCASVCSSSSYPLSSYLPLISSSHISHIAIYPFISHSYQHIHLLSQRAQLLAQALMRRQVLRPVLLAAVHRHLALAALDFSPFLAPWVVTD